MAVRRGHIGGAATYGMLLSAARATASSVTLSVEYGYADQSVRLPLPAWDFLLVICSNHTRAPLLN